MENESLDLDFLKPLVFNPEWFKRLYKSESGISVEITKYSGPKYVRIISNLNDEILVDAAELCSILIGLLSGLPVNSICMGWSRRSYNFSGPEPFGPHMIEITYQYTRIYIRAPGAYFIISVAQTKHIIEKLSKAIGSVLPGQQGNNHEVK